MENFVLYDEIGQGNERIVYKGRRKGTIEYLAIHCIEKSKRTKIQNNVRICHELNHDNIVCFKEWYETSNHLWLVVELCTGESLRTILMQDSYLPEETVKEFGKHVVAGLSYLHSLDIIYGDLQPSKILLDGNGILKLSNFSLARILGEADIFSSESYDEQDGSPSLESRLHGFPAYLAPELIRGDCPSKCSDLWAFGCLLYEMFTGTPPFKAISFQEMCQQIMEAKTPYPMQGQNGTFTKASENLFMLIQGLLQKSSTQRIDWLELCLHPFWDGELSHLADTVDIRTSQSILTNDSRCSSVLTACDITSKANEDEDNVINQVQQSDEKIMFNEEKPETNKKTHSKLHTSSLQFPDEKLVSVNSSVQSVTDNPNIIPWYGTYKLERGLAVMDLTEVSDSEKRTVHSATLAYPKSRELKASPSLSSKADIDLDTSVSSALSEFIPSVSGVELNILDHLHHPTDLIVTPIAENNKLRKLPPLKWENSILGFTPFSLDELQSNRKEELKDHIIHILNIYSQARKVQEKAVLRQKMNILAYLNSAAKTEDVSNIIVEENLTKFFLNDLKSSNALDLRIRIGRVLGVLASCVTYISPTYNMSEIFSISSDLIKQNFRSPQIKQAFLPVLGEFLFYAATQEESEDRTLECWEPSSVVFTIINRCLQQTDDHTSRHLAAKIIENVATTTGRYCKKILTNDIGLGLWNLFVHAGSDMEKQTAASALCRIAMHSPIVVQHVSDRAGFKAFQEALFSSTQKTQQAFFTILIILLSSPAHAKRMMQDQDLIQKIVQTLEGSSLVLRGKIYLLIAEMSVRSHDALLSCCESRLITHIERDSKRILSAGKENKEMLEYVHQCLIVVVHSVVGALPAIIDGVLHILDVVSGRHHPNPAQVKQLKIHLPLVQILLYLITSSMFRKRIVDDEFVRYIGRLLKQIKKIDAGEINLSSNATRSLSEHVTTTVFSIIEAMAQHPPLLLKNQSYFIDSVLPELAAFNNSENGDLRMLSFKLFSDICVLYLENEEEPGNHHERLLKVLQETFVPEFEKYLEDQHPLPSYALKLLYACTDKHSSIVEILLERNVISTLFHILRSYQNDINSPVLQSTVGILNNIVSSKDIDFMALCKQNLVEYMSSAFIEVASALEDNTSESIVSPLLLQLLDTLHHVLRNIELAVKSVLSNKPQSFNKHDVEDLLQESRVLGELNGILINLLVFNDVDIQKWSCRCLYLSAELFGGEYEECFSEDNVECICQFLNSTSRKQQKIMLRIIKRVISSNDALYGILSGDHLRHILDELLRSTSEEGEPDDKPVKSLCSELLNM